MLDQPAMRRGARTARVVVLALVIGVGLIAMHTGASHGEHEHSGTHRHAPVATAVVEDSSDAPRCEECASHGATTMACAVLLAAVAGGAAVRIIRRLAGCGPLVHVAPPGPPGWSRNAIDALARPPDLHALQVMRC